MDLCVLEEKRLGRPFCLNGGHCSTSANGTELRCLCESGWQGERCDVSFVKVNFDKLTYYLAMDH